MAICPVTSWRDSASQQVQDDLDGLLNEVLPFAQQFLAEYGEFYPYGAAVTSDGETIIVGGDPDQGDHPSTDDVLQAVVSGLRENRDNLRAVAMVSDFRLADTDGVRVELEHREGQSMAVVLPYRRRRFPRGVEYGEMQADQGDRKIWTTE